MDVVSEVEMPSPKRQRVEGQNLSSTAEPPDDLDDFSDIYGTPSKDGEIQSNIVSSPIIRKEDALSKTSLNEIPSLPSLPGLGNANANTAASDTATGTEHGLQTDVKRSIERSLEISETHSANGLEKQRSNGENLSKLVTPTDAADDSGSKAEETSTINHDMSSEKPYTDFEDVLSAVEVAPPLNSAPLQPDSIEDTLEDPLAFLEASLTSEPTQKNEDQKTIFTKKTEDAQDLVKDPTFEHVALANKHNVDAEFELDSSPLNSESESSDGSSSSNDSDDDDDYKMLDPEEQARRLMAEDGGSDDDGTTAKEKASGPLRTQNEKPDECVPKPDVTITEEMKIAELGTVEGTVENVVLIKARVSGEYQVLEQGSVLCLEDRSVIGVIAETLGRVEQPYYSVRFSNLVAIAEAGIAKSTKIFYVEKMSTSVFTQPLRAFKGSDASNLHDEEVGDDELEFSDDEAEAEHKRRVKLQRQQKRPGRDGHMDGFSKGPRGGRGSSGRGGGKRGGISLNGTHLMHGLQEQMPNATETTLDYDDNANEMKLDGEDLYTPLARPTNLHEIMQSQTGFSDSQGSQFGSNKAPHGRGRGRSDRGRGGRGGGPGHGRGRGQGPEGFRNRGGTSKQQQPDNFSPSHSQHTNGFTPPVAQQYPASSYQTSMTAAQQQPYSPLQPQYPQPHWNQSPTFQYPPQQYNSDAYQPQQPPQQQYPSYPHTSMNTNLAGSTNTSIPAGAHINPAFFLPQQQQLQHHQQQPQRWPRQQQ